jgi:pyridoxal 5'-phosphate synthase pdxT subunit
LKDETIIGVLAVQGDIEENITAANEALQHMEVRGTAKSVRYSKEINEVDGLIIPGGESTVISSLITIHEGSFQTIRSRISSGMPVMGSCAGMIMLSKRAYDRVVGETKQQLIGNLDIVIERNAFGRQNDSFETDLYIPILGKDLYKGIFIRSPVITEFGNAVDVIAKFNDKIVAVIQKNIIGTAFHPELSGDDRLHRHFINKVLEFRQNQQNYEVRGVGFEPTNP